MKKIGSGLQFNVYEFEKDKVLKIPRYRAAQVLKLLSWEPSLIFHPMLVFFKVREINSMLKESIRHLSKNKEHRMFLGNLEFLEKGIVQDRVILMGSLLTEDFHKNKKLIDGCLKCVVECWKRGFAEGVYNFDVNNGMTESGRVIQLDFGEVYFDKKKLKEDVAGRRWERAAFYNKRISGETKKYYGNQMEKLMTLKNVDKYWGGSK